MKLSEFIYKMNLVMTGTITDPREFCYEKEINKDVNYTESISLIELLSEFNDAYQKFIIDFKSLPSLDFLGQKVEYYHSYSQDNVAILYLIINKPNSEISDKPWCYLEIVKYNDGRIKCLVTNEIKWNNKSEKEIQLSQDTAEAYLSLIEKHISFLNCYEELKNKVIVGNGSTVLVSNINGEILSFLNRIRLSFGNSYFNSEDAFEISFQLEEPFQIALPESNISSDNIDQNELKNKANTINQLLNELYINLSYLPHFFQDRSQNIIRERKKTE